MEKPKGILKIRSLSIPKPFLMLSFFALIPLLTQDRFILRIFALTFVWAIYGSAWNVLGGYAGQFSLGHGAYFGIGGYTSIILFRQWGVSPWIGMIVGGIFAVVAAILISHTFRLRGPYFSLATMAYPMSLLALFYWLGYPEVYFPYLGDAPLYFQFTGMIPYYYIGLIFLLCVTLTIHKMGRSKFGLHLRAIREDEDAARSLGIDVTRHKVMALVLSAFISGLVGTFYFQIVYIITPDTAFGFVANVQPIFCTVMGGMGTVLGPILGALLYVPATLLLTTLVLDQQALGINLVILGALLMAFILWMPEGLYNRAAAMLSKARALWKIDSEKKKDEKSSRGRALACC